MPTTEFLVWLQGTPVAHAISKSNHLVGAGLQVVHILGFVLMLASLALVSIRVLGLKFGDRPVEDIAQDGIRLLWIGFGAATASGVLMFVATPLLYFPNPAFRVKMVLLLLALVLQLTVFRSVVRGSRVRPLWRSAGVALAVSAWVGIAMAGRLIGFI